MCTWACTRLPSLGGLGQGLGQRGLGQGLGPAWAKGVRVGLQTPNGWAGLARSCRAWAELGRAWARLGPKVCTWACRRLTIQLRLHAPAKGRAWAKGVHMGLQTPNGWAGLARSCRAWAELGRAWARLGPKVCTWACRRLTIQLRLRAPAELGRGLGRAWARLGPKVCTWACRRLTAAGLGPGLGQRCAHGLADA